MTSDGKDEHDLRKQVIWDLIQGTVRAVPACSCNSNNICPDCAKTQAIFSSLHSKKWSMSLVWWSPIRSGSLSRRTTTFKLCWWAQLSHPREQTKFMRFMLSPRLNSHWFNDHVLRIALGPLATLCFKRSPICVSVQGNSGDYHDAEEFTQATELLTTTKELKG